MGGTEPKDFFKQPVTASAIKAEVLPPFFKSWAEDRLKEQDMPLLFLDLNAGASVTFPDVALSAAGKVLKTLHLSAGSRPDLNVAVQTGFYEKDKTQSQALQQEVEELSYYPELAHPPLWLHQPEQLDQVKETLRQGTPALLALDPFGNKLTQELWHLALTQGNSDFLLLFEYKKMAATLKSNRTDSLLATLMGERFTKTRDFLGKPGPSVKKEKFALENLKESLREKAYQTSSFRINAPGKESAQFYLWLVSKNELAHTRFKEQLLPYAGWQEDGVPLFGANLRPVRVLVPDYYQYLEFSQVNLVQDLVQKAAQFKSMTLEKIYQQHNVGTPYCRDNYLAAMQTLKEQGLISLLNPKTGQVVHKLTFACRIKFK